MFRASNSPEAGRFGTWIQAEIARNEWPGDFPVSCKLQLPAQTLHRFPHETLYPGSEETGDQDAMLAKVKRTLAGEAILREQEMEGFS